MRRWILVLVLVLVLLGGGAIVVRALSASEASRRAKLIEEVRLALDELRAELAAEGIETFVGSTLRTTSDQALNVSNGTSATSQSWHLLGRAVDLYPIDPITKQPDLDGRTWDTLFRRMHELAPHHGFRGLAFNADGSRRYLTTSKGKIWDGGHLEFPGGMTWAVAAERFRSSGGLA